ncbi:MAG: hypothetical protein PWP08_703 [Methanofollis sp.]|nr:hypothetical protein [Methanofollis sp.]
MPPGEMGLDEGGRQIPGPSAKIRTAMPGRIIPNTQTHDLNGPTGTFCRKCGLTLTEQATAEVDGISIEEWKLMANDPGLLLQAAQVLQQGMDEARQATR